MQIGHASIYAVACKWNQTDAFKQPGSVRSCKISYGNMMAANVAVVMTDQQDDVPGIDSPGGSSRMTVLSSCFTSFV